MSLDNDLMATSKGRVKLFSLIFILKYIIKNLFIIFISLIGELPCKIAVYNVAKCQFTYINSYVKGLNPGVISKVG